MSLLLRKVLFIAGVLATGGPGATIQNEIFWDDGDPDAMLWDDGDFVAWDD